MRKLGLVLVISLLFSVSALDVSLTLGLQEKATNHHEHSPIYVTINLWQDIKFIRLFATYTNEMYYLDPYFAPTQDFYTVGIRAIFPHVTISLEHMCQHPVVSLNRWSGLHGGHNKIEVTISNKRMLY
jgi:hypothetical protein